MDLKVVLGIALVAVAALVLSACRMTKAVRLQHEPSEYFYRTYDFTSDTLSPFKTDDILFVVNAKAATHSSYIVWLGLYSDQAGKAVQLNEAVISNGSWETRQVFTDSAILDALLSEHGLYKQSVKLFEIDTTQLSGLDAEDDLTIEVSFSIDGKAGRHTFLIERKTEKQAVYPT